MAPVYNIDFPDRRYFSDLQYDAMHLDEHQRLGFLHTELPNGTVIKIDSSESYTSYGVIFFIIDGHSDECITGRILAHDFSDYEGETAFKFTLKSFLDEDVQKRWRLDVIPKVDLPLYVSMPYVTEAFADVLAEL